MAEPKESVRVSMRWEELLANPYTMNADGQPTVHLEVRDWQEDLAGEIVSSISAFEIEWDEAEIVVDLNVFLPHTATIDYDVEALVPAILTAVEMATGKDRGQMVPFIRNVSFDLEDPGFLIRLYAARFGGHGLRGTIIARKEQTTILLDRILHPDWTGARVSLNLGVISHEH